MTKVYEKSKDVNVANTVIYTKNNKAYKDVSCETQYTVDELREAFLKGSIIDIQPGAYNNKYSIQSIPQSFSMTYKNLGVVNFSFPHIRRNEYPAYVSEEVENVTLIGQNSTIQATNDNELFIHGQSEDPNIRETFGIEFGEGTVLYSVLSSLGDSPKTISFDAMGFYPVAITGYFYVKCGDDIIETSLVDDYKRVQLTTSGNKVQMYVDDSKQCAYYIRNLQVELGTEATPYETPASKDWEDISYAESLPDPE